MKPNYKGISVVIMLLLYSNVVFPYDFEVNGIYYGYNSSDQSVYVTSGENKYSGTVTIPKTIVYNNRTMPVKTVSGFKNCTELEGVIIPEGITRIVSGTFQGCTKLSNVNLPESLEELGDDYYGSDGVFEGCVSLESIVIPDGVKSITKGLFLYCTSLKNVSMGKGIESINSNAFDYCISLEKIIIPQNTEQIFSDVFRNCNKLDTILIEDSDKALVLRDYLFDHHPKAIYLGRNIQGMNSKGGKTEYFYGVSNLDSLSLLTIGPKVSQSMWFSDQTQLREIYCMHNYPLSLSRDDCFWSSVYVNATLYVPVGTSQNYSSAYGWENFFNIQEMEIKAMWNGGQKTENSSIQKCEKPTIHFNNGRLTFVSSTNGASFHTEISNTDIKTYNQNAIDLNLTYVVNVYASAPGYNDSDITTATLCWLSSNPEMDGIVNNNVAIRGDAVMVQNENGILTISGVKRESLISIYSQSGILIDSAKASDRSVFYTDFKSGDIVIIKIDDNTIKVTINK